MAVRTMQAEAPSDARSLLDPRPGIPDLPGERLQDFGLLGPAQGGQVGRQLSRGHLATYSRSHHSVTPAPAAEAPTRPKVLATVGRVGPGRGDQADEAQLWATRDQCRPSAGYGILTPRDGALPPRGIRTSFGTSIRKLAGCSKQQGRVARLWP